MGFLLYVQRCFGWVNQGYNKAFLESIEGEVNCFKNIASLREPLSNYLLVHVMKNLSDTQL